MGNYGFGSGSYPLVHWDIASAKHHSQEVRACLTILAVMPGAGNVSADEGIRWLKASQ